MSQVRPLLCRHCERGLAVSSLGLCQKCQETKGIRRLYQVRRHSRGEEWERHLRVLARRARKGLPVGGISLSETL